jgi:hypothetical protein
MNTVDSFAQVFLIAIGTLSLFVVSCLCEEYM